MKNDTISSSLFVFVRYMLAFSSICSVAVSFESCIIEEYWFSYGQGACVQNVLDSVISALFDDKNRKFIYVEMVLYYLGFLESHFSEVVCIYH